MPITNPAETKDQIARQVDRIRYHLNYSLGKRARDATRFDMFKAVALCVREALSESASATEDRYERHSTKRLYYLSMEFLLGRLLSNNLRNLRIYDSCKEAVGQMGFDLEDILEEEPDAALGNGGLGRLAACFLDSLATLGMPGYGYGINYEFGLFKQEIEDGSQKERPDNWLSNGSPWEIDRPDEACIVPLRGNVVHAVDREGEYNPMWMDWNVMIGVPHDIPVAGYGNRTTNVLRLFSARASSEFDTRIFNEGDYIRAVEQKITSEAVSKILYPSDSSAAGKELRLLQEYFLVACAMRDIFRRFFKDADDVGDFPDQVAIQMNDTHPALAIAELMRTLVDEHDVPWDKAWEITQATCAYTNHTLMPEALEKWTVSLMNCLLPRHLQIIYEINHRFLSLVEARWPGDKQRAQRLSLVEEGDHKQIRMANLAIVGSHSINGVAAIHSKLLQTDLVPDFYQLWPGRFNNKTNGVTPRRWLMYANPQLAELITRTIGSGWLADYQRIAEFEEYVQDEAIRDAFLKARRERKEYLANWIYANLGIRVDPASLFDVHIKRLHEYKRQLMNVLHVIHQYLSFVREGRAPWVPKTYIFGAKAAPGYAMAKLVIKLINSVAAVINRDARLSDCLKVVFVPDYKVSLAEKIIPAADLSEQISTAGMEASGTGNMKMAMNGALTIGTLDGANVEICEQVGPENLFIFGLTAEQVAALRRSGSYDPAERYRGSELVRRVMDALKDDTFCRSEPGLFRPIFDSLVHGSDGYFVLADLESYAAAQATASREFAEPRLWATKSMLNVARVGIFSSDRTVAEYAKEIWHLKPVLD